MATQLSRILVRNNVPTVLVGDETLSPAELIFCPDSGRVFIGAGTQASDMNFDSREESPGRNIEVLTEASIETFRRMLITLGVDVPDNIPE